MAPKAALNLVAMGLVPSLPDHSLACVENDRAGETGLISSHTPARTATIRYTPTCMHNMATYED